MKNEPHVIGDRVPDGHALSAELKLVSQNAGIPGSAGPMAVAGMAPYTLARRFFGFLAKTVQDRSNRLALLELNDDQLKDIGISRCQAYGEYSRYRRSDADDASPPGMSC